MYANGNSFGNPNGAALNGDSAFSQPAYGEGIPQQPQNLHARVLAVRTWNVR